MKSIINLLNTLKTKLQGMEWKVSAEEVFASDSVIVSLGVFTEDSIKSLRPPICIISPGASNADSEQPGFQTFNITISLITFQAGDLYGEIPLMGRNINSPTVVDAGILELAEEVKKEIQKLSRFEGVPMNFYGVSQLTAQLDSEGYNYIISIDLNFQGRVSSE